MSTTPPDDDVRHSLDDDTISKSERKRQMDYLQKLGRQIIDLSPEIRARLPLSDDMEAAVIETGRIRSHEGIRRHMQYVGKVMRSEDIAGIEAAFTQMEQEKYDRDHAFHQLEQLRDRLVAEGDDALGELLAQYPTIERQTVRQLIRNAQRERDAQKPPTSARKLFRVLRDAADL